jgi:succinate dehydrogenase/fumarate reductase flavoprotein subunit
VTNELPNANSPSASSVSVYSLAPAILENLVPSSWYDLPDAIVVDAASDVYVADAGAKGTVYAPACRGDGRSLSFAGSVCMGTGRLKMAGGVSGAMKESLQRAGSYILTRRSELGIARDLVRCPGAPPFTSLRLSYEWAPVQSRLQLCQRRWVCGWTALICRPHSSVIRSLELSYRDRAVSPVQAMAIHRFILLILLFGPALAADKPDLIVVGAGISGLCAALEGARAGLKVTVVELNSVPGGHAVISSGGVSLIGTPLQESNKIVDSPEIAERDFLNWGEDANREWVHFYTWNSKAMIYDWMTSLGTEFVGVSLNGAANSVPRFHSPNQQGIGLVIPVYREILRQGGVTFLFGHRVIGLQVDSGRVTGVKMRNLRKGEESTLTGGAVLLSTGGFGADLDLVRASWPKSMPVPERILAGGGFFANGAGMTLARDAGGASGWLDHQWNYASGLPDPFDPQARRGFFANASGAIWVNSQGKRFVLEQHEPKATIPVIAAQRPARFWAVFDADGRRTFRITHAGFTEERLNEVLNYPGLISKGDTIEQLASAAGLPADALRETVERYNEMVDSGEDTDFHRFGPKRPRGYGPPARKIVQPPFYAAPMYILIRKSLGGIKVDTSCRVLNDEGKPVPGLLASGEAAGFGGLNGRHGMEGTFLGPAILMGRVAAQTVAGAANRKPAAESSAQLRLTPPAADRRLASTCSECHDLPKLVEAGRDGYWHFEHSHRLVISRKLNCTGCHAEMAPFRAAGHRIDRQLQTAVCQHCHTNPPFSGRRPAAVE